MERIDGRPAITMKGQAVTSTPDDHPKRAVYLNNLGNALERRFDRTGSTDDLERSIATKEEAVAIHTAPPRMRILAADSASRLLIDRDWDRANAILRIAVELLPTTSPRMYRPGTSKIGRDSLVKEQGVTEQD